MKFPFTKLLWLFCLLFCVSLKNTHVNHHCQWRAEKFGKCTPPTAFGHIKGGSLSCHTCWHKTWLIYHKTWYRSPVNYSGLASVWKKNSFEHATIIGSTVLLNFQYVTQWSFMQTIKQSIFFFRNFFLKHAIFNVEKLIEKLMFCIVIIAATIISSLFKVIEGVWREKFICIC